MHSSQIHLEIQLIHKNNYSDIDNVSIALYLFELILLLVFRIRYINHQYVKK